jgi:hypothetical protein
MFMKVTFDRFKQEFITLHLLGMFPNCLEDLFNYFNDDGSQFKEVEFDAIDLCHKYTEYETLYEALSEYPDLKIVCRDFVDFEKTLANFKKKTLVIGDPKDTLSPFILKNF